MYRLPFCTTVSLNSDVLTHDIRLHHYRSDLDLCTGALLSILNASRGSSRTYRRLCSMIACCKQIHHIHSKRQSVLLIQIHPKNLARRIGPDDKILNAYHTIACWRYHKGKHRSGYTSLTLRQTSGSGRDILWREATSQTYPCNTLPDMVE